MEKPGKVLVYWARGIDNDVKNAFQRVAYKKFAKAGKKFGSQVISDKLAEIVKARLGLPPSTVLSEDQWYSVSFNPGKFLRDNNFGPKNIFSKVVKFLGNVAKVVSSIPKAALKLAALAPFKGAMKKALDRRKIPYTNKLNDIAQKFYHVVVKKKSAFENFEPVTVSVLLAAILPFFKQLFNKEEPTEEEEELLEIAEKDLDREDELISYEMSQLDDGTGNTPVTPTGGGSPIKFGSMVIILVIVIVAYKMFKK